MSDEFNGWLLIDKPERWTSFDAVNKVRGVVAAELGLKPKRVKVGHTGTLDPIATGLLILGIGKATKQIEGFMKQDKNYEATMTLGSKSTTGDSEGELVFVSDLVPEQTDIEKTIASFIGEIEQTPPRFSALKIDGIAAYARARAGEEFEINKRKITIHEAKFIEYSYPEVEFSCRVSSGTYIRSLIEDYGAMLETGGYMTGLRRTSIANFDLAQAISPDGITIDKIRSHLKPLDFQR